MTGEIARKFLCRSDRVKAVDLHRTEPWVLTSLYNGSFQIWNFESNQLVKSLEVCDVPIRAAKFISRKNWIVMGCDDMKLVVFNYNTLEHVTSFEAHADYIRCIAVHPTQSIILSSSDDMLIKLWNWEQSWSCQQVYEGHTHYVMQVIFNPKDNNTFASASLDCTIKVWQMGSSVANFTLEGHQKGINCICYYYGGDKPYLVSGGDDHLVKIWDFQNKTCVQSLEGHANNVSSVCVHPSLPVLLSGSEDGKVCVWHSGTYRLQKKLYYGLDRVWCIAALQNSNHIAIGNDEGTVVIKMGRDEPAVSMDSSGKIIWSRHCEIQQANLKTISNEEIKDGEIIPVTVRDLGSCDVFPHKIIHSPNSRFVAVCGEGEYIVYTAVALRSKCFGSASQFVWSADSSYYAVTTNSFTVKVFKNFKDKPEIKSESCIDGLFGGELIGIKCGDSFSFYDWDSHELIRRIDICVNDVFWNGNGEMVCLATEDTYFILKYFPSRVAAAKEQESALIDGVEEAFKVIDEVSDSVKSGVWVGDCFIYTNSSNRLVYHVGGELVTVAHLDRTMYVLGYVCKDNRVYLGDKDISVVSYSILVSILEYQTCVMREDFDTADKILLTIPKSHYNRVAHFLENKGYKKQALAVSSDLEQRFNLSLELEDTELAYKLAEQSDHDIKWKQLAGVCLRKHDYVVAKKCMEHAKDYGGLLLLATSMGDVDGVADVGALADSTSQNNISFLSYFTAGNLSKCLEILIQTQRLPEAAFFARTYLPSEMSKVVKLWKESVKMEKIANAIADPEKYQNLFPEMIEKEPENEDEKQLPESSSNQDLCEKEEESELRCNDRNLELSSNDDEALDLPSDLGSDEVELDVGSDDLGLDDLDSNTLEEGLDENFYGDES